MVDTSLGEDARLLGLVELVVEPVVVVGDKTFEVAFNAGVECSTDFSGGPEGDAAVVSKVAPAPGASLVEWVVGESEEATDVEDEDHERMVRQWMTGLTSLQNDGWYITSLHLEQTWLKPSLSVGEK